MENTDGIRKLLLIIVIPLVLYLLHITAFIFIPLISAMFIALLFTPLMRFFEKKRIGKTPSLIMVIIIIIGCLYGTGQLIKLSSQEIVHADDSVWENMAEKLDQILLPVQEMMGVEADNSESFSSLIKEKGVSSAMFSGFGSSVKFLRSTLMLILMTLFFLVLYLAGSVNIYKILEASVFKNKITTKRVMIKVEKSIVKFIKVKFLLSLFTGIGFSVACLIFDVSFPVFWGLFAFAINFVQMIGSVISTVLLSIFALAEIDSSGSLLVFVLMIAGTQILFGGILEPIFMGQTFSINTVTVLMMLMLWGFIWGIPGLILSIPITVVLKTLLEENPKTKVIGDLMS